jgi:Uma2 family endonuclease
MVGPAPKPRATFAEYLARERASETKHELINGDIYAMAGGTLRHGLLSLNVGAELRAQLRDRPCRVFNSDVRVRVLETGLATYPDVSVVCGKVALDPEDENSLANPVVLVEVLSPSTESYDRNAKFAHYRRIPSLREYVLISQDEQHIEHYRRNEDGTWTLRDVRPPGAVELASIGCSLSLAELYRGAFDDDATR